MGKVVRQKVGRKRRVCLRCAQIFFCLVKFGFSSFFQKFHVFIRLKIVSSNCCPAPGTPTSQSGSVLSRSPMTGTPQMDLKNSDRRLQGASIQGASIQGAHALQGTATRLLKGAY